MISKIIRFVLHVCNSLHYYWFKWYNPRKFRAYGVSVGDNSRLLGSIYLKVAPSAKCAIGSGVEISSGHCINPLTRNIKASIVLSDGALLEIGNNTGMSSVVLWVRKSLIIGNNVKIGGGTVFLDSDAHSLNYKHRQNLEDDKRDRRDAEIVVEDDVLIGAFVTVLKGVTIGARSVIGANSVVTKSIPADCIAVGNPCRVIKTINNEN